MDTSCFEKYLKIVGDDKGVSQVYHSPGEQGESIKKCSILKPVNLAYSNGTTLNNEQKASQI